MLLMILKSFDSRYVSALLIYWLLLAYEGAILNERRKVLFIACKAHAPEETSGLLRISRLVMPVFRSLLLPALTAIFRGKR
jgi:hypothetical protein